MKKNNQNNSNQDENSSNENKLTRIEKYLKSKYDFQYNIVYEDTEFRQRGTEKFSSISERSIAKLRIELTKQGFTGFKGLLDDLLKSDHFCPDFNPFKNYFQSLPPWDGNDYISELLDHVRLEDETQRPWYSLMFRKHLMRTVACSLRILPFNKQCLVLLGKQNDGKTSFLRFLTPKQLKDYYKENPPLDHKDSILALGKYFIINIDELHDLGKADANKVKSLFSQAEIKVRAHYASKDSSQARYASFFGTTNEREFLNDPTGNVRWLVFEVDGFQHDQGGKNGYSQRVNIDNVWAQAYALVLKGEACELSSEEIKKVEEANRSYQRTTSELDYVSKYIIGSERGMPNTYAVTSTDILDAIQAVTKTSNKLSSVQIGRALTHLKIKKHPIRLPYQANPTSRYFVTSNNPDILNYLAAHVDYIAT
ncbi:VapE domain-containing protein [Telluribacter humicola]|uniref:VapE domain-containing protein n=1 Tax=Telluribacter humicola TaxID=1720261 RepID=UPI001A96845D|nr:VapE domain-containing protein [Telluribacter humicola]